LTKDCLVNIYRQLSGPGYIAERSVWQEEGIKAASFQTWLFMQKLNSTRIVCESITMGSFEKSISFG